MSRTPPPPESDPPEIKSADDALSFLLEELQKANLLIATGKDAGRAHAVATLIAFDQFLSFFPSTIDYRQPIGELLNALLSLEEGQVLSLLKPRKRQRHEGRAPASTGRVWDKAAAVLAVHRLCETGMKRDEADDRVAKVCCEAGLQRSRRGKGGPGQGLEVTARTVRGWREETAADVGRHSEAAQVLDHLQSQTPKTQAIAQLIAQAIKSKDAKAMRTVRKGLLEGLRLSLTHRRASEH